MAESTPNNYAEAVSPKPSRHSTRPTRPPLASSSPRHPVHHCTAVVAAAVPERLVHLADEPVAVQRHGRVQCSPVAEDTCLMFPGHSKLEWTFAVNAWIFGAMVGSLCCGHFSDKYGRKKALMGNCIFMIVGGVVQASVSNIWIFALGRLIAGISSGTATATIGGYINELSPPHMRNTLGLGLQIFTTIGILLGLALLAAFPVVLAVVYLLLAPTLCIESPAWLLNQGRKEEAKQVIARLYGEEHVQTALSWLEVSKKPENAEEGLAAPKQESMFNPRYRMQLLGGILLIFSDAGISDSRVGTLIIDFINIFPAFFTVCWPTASALAT
ncbi:Major facilitator superfamily domain [Phytophthora cactorum]|nr:Major facilitator superfamily domain [Phytophthora cactorum]